MPDNNNQKIIMQLDIKIQHQVIEEHVAASPYDVGVELAEQINSYVHENKLGYYPALDYFRDKQFIDPDLIGTAESIAWLIENLSLESLRTWLQPEFSELSCDTIKAQLFLLPNIRPSHNNVLHSLQNHFTPDHIKATLSGELVTKTTNKSELLNECKKSLKSALKGKFAYMDIINIYLLDN